MHGWILLERNSSKSWENALMQLPKPTPDIIICGDFNLPHASWPEGKIKPGASTDEQFMIEYLMTFINEFYFTQEILTPTHNRGNNNNNNIIIIITLYWSNLYIVQYYSQLQYKSIQYISWSVANKCYL